nr:hypothetical protein [Catellatospora vulcania]
MTSRAARTGPVWRAAHATVVMHPALCAISTAGSSSAMTASCSAATRSSSLNGGPGG